MFGETGVIPNETLLPSPTAQVILELRARNRRLRRVQFVDIDRPSWRTHPPADSTQWRRLRRQHHAVGGPFFRTARAIRWETLPVKVAPYGLFAPNFFDALRREVFAGK